VDGDGRSVRKSPDLTSDRENPGFRLSWARSPRPILTVGLEFLSEERHSLHPRKEVIQPQVPLRLPCYDFTPITSQTLDVSLPKVGSTASGSASFRDVTGGVYKARERIHRGMLIRDY
jgi:hypothetical protein